MAHGKCIGLTLLVLLAGCAHSYDPIVDMRDADPQEYNHDLEECRAYADKVDMAGDAGEDTLIGGVFGAALGAAAGAVTGHAGLGAATGAAIGGVGGGGTGALSAGKKQRKIIDKCLTGRGYRVLG